MKSKNKKLENRALALKKFHRDISVNSSFNTLLVIVLVC